MSSNNSESQSPKKAFSVVLKEAFSELKETSIAFVKAPKALWGVNVPYVLEGLVYFGILTILGKYAAENVGLLDTQASLIYSLVTGGITFFMLVLGGYSDKLGVRSSITIAFIAFAVGRIFVALSGTLTLDNGLWSPMFFMMNFGLLLMVVGYGLYQPAAYAGVKRYTTPQTAAMGYAAIYGFMNLGAFLSGFISSFSRQGFEDTFPPNGLTAVFWIYVGITVFALLVSMFLLTKKSDEDAVKMVEESLKKNSTKANEAEKEEEEPDIQKPKINNALLTLYGILTLTFLTFSNVILGSEYSTNLNFGLFTIDLFLLISIALGSLFCFEYLKNRPFHPFRDPRFTFFIFILVPVQTLFAHNWLTIPLYLDRAFAGSFIGEYFEVFSNLNPILIFFLAPIVAGLTSKANIYKMMIYGTMVMALPTFLLTVGPSTPLFLLYILLMTIGESMWQPRFLQWISEVAPKGMTGLYMGVGQFPWFLTKVITGFYSGWFLMNYCPIDTLPQDMSTGMMWFIYGLIAMVSPIGLILAKKWMMKGLKEKY
ncbi:MAG: MFS transporter [Melioribacteraceae bacterium]|nr:MFS transporter [Melioribacteraceae bacterium]MCF8264274.1 MFS transporter [Melioribacteraceae bacterium]MCF8413406.1 MFS transporter [Melioribacteraceae bacterium]